MPSSSLLRVPIVSFLTCLCAVSALHAAANDGPNGGNGESTGGAGPAGGAGGVNGSFTAGNGGSGGGATPTPPTSKYNPATDGGGASPGKAGITNGGQGGVRGGDGAQFNEPQPRQIAGGGGGGGMESGGGGGGRGELSTPTVTVMQTGGGGGGGGARGATLWGGGTLGDYFGGNGGNGGDGTSGGGGGGGGIGAYLSDGDFLLSGTIAGGNGGNGGSGNKTEARGNTVNTFGGGGGAGAHAVYLSHGTLTAHGTLIGGNAGAGGDGRAKGSNGGLGGWGAGVDVGGVMINHGSTSGGKGGDGGDIRLDRGSDAEHGRAGSAGGGGEGVVLRGSTLQNEETGSVVGGTGGGSGSRNGLINQGAGTSGNGGAGVMAQTDGSLSATVVNRGTITGGEGGFNRDLHSTAQGGSGGAGISAQANGGVRTFITNHGSIYGGNGGGSQGLFGGSGGAGILASDATVYNHGLVSGGLNPKQGGRANAITFNGGINHLHLYASSAFEGRVVAESGTNTLHLDGNEAADLDGSNFSGFDLAIVENGGTWTLRNSLSSLNEIQVVGASAIFDASIGSDTSSGRITADTGGTLTLQSGVSITRRRVDVINGGHLINGGAITGDAARSVPQAVVGGTGGKLTNEGTISGDGGLTAVLFDSVGTLVNRGTIETASAPGLPQHTVKANDAFELTNSGTITGNVDLAPNKKHIVTLEDAGQISGHLTIGTDTTSELILSGTDANTVSRFSEAVGGTTTFQGTLRKRGATKTWEMDIDFTPQRVQIEEGLLILSATLGGKHVDERVVISKGATVNLQGGHLTPRVDGSELITVNGMLTGWGSVGASSVSFLDGGHLNVSARPGGGEAIDFARTVYFSDASSATFGLSAIATDEDPLISAQDLILGGALSLHINNFLQEETGLWNLYSASQSITGNFLSVNMSGSYGNVTFVWNDDLWSGFTGENVWVFDPINGVLTAEAIPEGSTWLLFGIGFAALIFARRRLTQAARS